MLSNSRLQAAASDGTVLPAGLLVIMLTHHHVTLWELQHQRLRRRNPQERVTPELLIVTSAQAQALS
jgi:hypothetical protein